MNINKKTFVCTHRKQNSLSNAIYPDEFAFILKILEKKFMFSPLNLGETTV
jgi:hypothetical protein